jgi:hypothetical protein
VVDSSNALGQTLTASNTFAQAGGGDLYGGLLVIHLPHQWSWKSEYAWGYNTLDLGGSAHHGFGRAWQSGITGPVKSAAISLVYFETGTNFVSPANPGLTATSIPSRRGVNSTFTLPTKLGNFTVGEQFSQSNANSTSTIEQTMNAVSEGWARNFGPKTMLSATLHETLVGSGDVPPVLQTLPKETLSILQADQRDTGAALTATRQIGHASLNLTGSRDWTRNNLNPSADVITTSLLAGETWMLSNVFQIGSSFGINWTAAEKSTVGTTRALTGHFQPAFTWNRPGLQLAPIVSFNQTRTELLAGALSNQLTTGQYGGRISWTMPSEFKFSTLSFEGDFNRNKNLLTGADLSDKALMLVWTLTWARQQELRR